MSKIRTPLGDKKIAADAKKMLEGEADQRFVVYLTADQFAAIETFKAERRIKRKKALFLDAFRAFGVKV